MRIECHVFDNCIDLLFKLFIINVSVLWISTHLRCLEWWEMGHVDGSVSLSILWSHLMISACFLLLALKVKSLCVWMCVCVCVGPARLQHSWLLGWPMARTENLSAAPRKQCTCLSVIGDCGRGRKTCCEICAQTWGSLHGFSRVEDAQQSRAAETHEIVYSIPNCQIRDRT